ncbi:MAG TPA: aminopeptidase P N-terminal domain-containing protein [Jatrophihabitans sp.]|jgi:Xaa-Pro aminopeptidase|uniref:aminopeptidase P N-terminal domain-containing protein n=1 Tax=Jatrophihabitans sp. TaxID=1932789 RepID=UPI002DFBA839|nr:aminopeptidase P N-terminal domain-containing protein [Jatrophihabitans sp.]
MAEDQTQPDETESHDIPFPEHLRQAVAADWDPAPVMPHPARPDVAPHAAPRRAALSAKYPRQLIVIPAGGLRPRANDTDFAFRASSSFTWLTGETVEDAVLVMTPTDTGHDATLYVREYAQPGEVSYFTSRLHAAIWVGNVPSLGDTADVLAISTRPLAALAGDLAAFRDDAGKLLRGLDPAVDALLPKADDTDLARTLDELRLVKDDWELDRLRHACEITARGFADVAREIPHVIGRGDLRGERWLEGTFWRRARLEGNEVGYTSIVGSGAHATTLHWWRNHGVIEPGTLLLADMGVETDELYTADVTRTMPVDGVWSPAQLKVYRAVQEAQATGIAEVKAGADFLAAHKAAMFVLADHLHSWGVLPVTAEVSCAEDVEAPGAGLHRRWTLHGTSHMLGIDVHDCALARQENYREGTLAAGHVLTVEPGLYFQPNDRSVPAELRGIGVRIEDDIVVTDGAPINLSGDLPRDPDEIVAWMRDAQGSPAAP